MSIAHWLMLMVTLMVVASLATSFGGFMVLTVERREPVGLTVQKVATYIRDGLARVLFMALEPIGRRDQPPKQITWNTEGNPAPVLLLPSVGWSRSTLFFLRAFLQRRGWSVVWGVIHDRAELTLADRAELLEDQVKELRRFTGAEKIDLVCHGVGGLVGAWFIRHRDGAQHIRRLVTLGTPWQGTKMAVFLRGDHTSELLHGAHQLDSLAPPGAPTIAIWSPDDNFVVPSNSAIAEDMPNVSIEGAGHMDLLVSARAFRAVQAALTHPIGDST